MKNVYANCKSVKFSGAAGDIGGKIVRFVTRANIPTQTIEFTIIREKPGSNDTYSTTVEMSPVAAEEFIEGLKASLA